MTQRCVLTLTQCHIIKVKVTVHTCPKPCPGHNSSLPCWILIIYHANVSWPWLRVLSPMSRSQCTHGKIVSRPLPFTVNLDGDDTSHNCLPWHRFCCGGYLSRKDMTSFIYKWCLAIYIWHNWLASALTARHVHYILPIKISKFIESSGFVTVSFQVFSFGFSTYTPHCHMSSTMQQRCLLSTGVRGQSL